MNTPELTKYENLPDEVKEWTEMYIKRTIRKSHPLAKSLSKKMKNLVLKGYLFGSVPWRQLHEANNM